MSNFRKEIVERAAQMMVARLDGDDSDDGQPARTSDADGEEELREVIRFAVELRRRTGLHPERIRGQVHGKYQTVMRECGVPESAIPSGD